MPYIATIVEGHGEVAALPRFLHRYYAQLGHAEPLVVNPPIRVKSGSFVNDEAYFRRQLTLAVEKAASRKGAVLILLDCEDECPASLGPRLLERARAVRGDIPILVVLAYREFESWFIAAVSSLGGLHGIPVGIQPPVDLESIRDAKGWLGTRMDGGYDPMVHQYIFVGAMDFAQARVSKSFDRLCNRLLPLLTIASA